MVIVRGHRRVRGAVRRQRKAQSILGSGLAHRAGDSNDLGSRARAGGGGKSAQGGEHVWNREQWSVRRKFREALASDHRKTCVGGQRRGDEFVPVAPLTWDG